MSDINDVFGNEESGFEAVFGGSFPGDYNDLSNKPSIESHELVGNKTAEDLGLAKRSEVYTKTEIDAMLIMDVTETVFGGENDG